ncbi:acetyltransferase [Pelosinus propionicus]|uniref:UDP-perosamine 4-acetyltransferase n=1 Tax=Pelosinus propionicus DSM 13327 TaxID=1123291 RepID=A0A1I4HTM3_9FIRM|nr:acetyltransferase [Pelosinus propionicus]SFL45150.1 UDP-perosamine 4-acetyltransferase [Pelosinus propionicus DSM 13327]
MIHPVIVVGAGGHAKVIIDMLLASSVEIIGATDSDLQKKGNRVLGIPIIGDDEVILQYNQEKIFLVNGIGSIGLPVVRTQIFHHFKQLGYSFQTIIHPSAILSLEVTVGEGSQIMAGAIIQPGCQIGANSIINTAATVDHDCVIGSNVHLSPGTTLSGGVGIGDGVHIGTGAVIIQGIQIGKDSVVGAGAVVVKNVVENTKVMGVPAREV